jgi:membrane protein required for colicin V production
MNSFDAAVYGLMLVAVVTGYGAGFLRSMATILGYLAAMPIAVATASLISPSLADPGGLPFAAPWAGNWVVVFGIFLAAGVGLGALLRFSISEAVGPSVNMVDRLAGSLFGAVRILLVFVTMVLIVDQLIPLDQQPDFLRESRVRPMLSMAGQQGLKSLPPEIAAYIDQLRRDRRI